MADLPDPPDRLDSWKEIALFLGRTVRTVQRWEKSEGLPVHRGGTTKRGSVIGSKREIGDWWHRRRATLEVEDADPDNVEIDDAQDGAARSRRRWLKPFAWLAGVAAAILVTIGLSSNRRNTVTVSSAAAAPVRHARLLASWTSERGAIREVPLGAEPGGVVAASAGDRVYAALMSTNQIAIVDVRAGVLEDRIPVPEMPFVLAVGPDPDLLFVGGRTQLTIINTKTRESRSVRLDGAVRDLAVTAGGQRIWIAMAQAGLKVMDLATGNVETRPTIGCPMQFAYDTRGGRLFVSYQCKGPGGRWGHDAIEIIDESSRRSLVAKSGPPMVGHMLALASSGAFLWADAHDGCATVDYDHVGCPPGRGAVLHAFNAENLDPVISVRVPASSTQSTPLAFPDGSRLAVRAEGVHVVNAALGHVEERIDLPTLVGITFGADGTVLAATHHRRQALLLFPLTTRGDARQFNGLAGYWPGDGTANDLAGGTHALPGSTPSYGPGRLGQAFAFGDASSAEPVAEISFGKRMEVDVAYEPMTVAAWIKPREIGAPMAIVNRSGPVGWRWWVTAEGRPVFCMTPAPASLDCDAGGLVASTPLGAGDWHHIAVVRSDDAVTLFEDGVAVASRSLAGYVKPKAEAWDDRYETRIGSAGGGRLGFRGLIDELAMFRRALTSKELIELARATSLQK